MSDLKLVENADGSFTASAALKIPEGVILIVEPWHKWGLKERDFRPGVRCGEVSATRRTLVGIINEMAQYLEHYAPGKFDFEHVKEVIHAYQNEVVFEIGKPKGRDLKMNVREYRTEIPAEGGRWIDIDLGPVPKGDE